jgi:putative transposase
VFVATVDQLVQRVLNPPLVEVTSLQEHATPTRAQLNDAGWSTFVGMVAYEAARHGRVFGKVDRWFPSTRRCSTCGAVGEPRPLHVRAWTCPCGAVHDRDVNAAINILAAGRADRPKPVELMSDGTPVPRSAAKQEPTGSAA